MSKTEGTMYRCDKCGEAKFLSCADIAKDGGLSVQGVHKLSVGKRKEMHLCESCYLQFLSWLDEKPTTDTAVDIHMMQSTDKPTKSKCMNCKHRTGEIFNKYCRECSHAWADLYEEAENDKAN